MLLVNRVEIFSSTWYSGSAVYYHVEVSGSIPGITFRISAVSHELGAIYLVWGLYIKIWGLYIRIWGLYITISGHIFYI